MARLSDLIKQGKIPEKKQDEEVKIRNLERLKEDKDAVKTKQEGGSSSEEISEMNLPTEAREDKLPDKITLENISLPSEDELTAPSKEGLEEQKRIEGLYATIYDFIEGVISSLKRKKRFTIEKGLEIVKDIVHTENATNILYGKAVQGKGIPDNLSAHSANVCIYSLILGKGVDYSQEKLIELGITALLHDIGMVFVPNGIVNKLAKVITIEKLRAMSQMGSVVDSCLIAIAT